MQVAAKTGETCTPDLVLQLTQMMFYDVLWLSCPRNQAFKSLVEADARLQQRLLLLLLPPLLLSTTICHHHMFDSGRHTQK
jgi:hypothetical protein